MSLNRSIIEAFASGVRRPPDMTVSEWADDRRILSSESSSEPGKWKTSRTPYLREPMECLTDDVNETITMIFASQTGKSETMFNAMGYVIDIDPSPMMMVQPTLDMAEAVSKDRIDPMLRTTPELADKVRAAKGEGKSQKTLQKSFPGGQLVMVGANAPASLASRPIRFVFMDEVDRFPMSAGEEGDPVQLAVRRTVSFRHNRKILLTSTPTLKGISRVEKSYELSDQRKYFLPCPHCGHKQTLEFENIHYEVDEPENAAIMCSDCGTLWSEAERLQALSLGKWVATKPENKGHAGFHLNALYSPWYEIKDIVIEYLSVKDDPAQYRTFVNTVLAETYADETDHIEEKDIVNRMTAIGLDLVPAPVMALFAGVDIQIDRAEITYLGVGQFQEYILAHEIIYGDPTGDKLWKDIDEAVSRKFPHALGGEIGCDGVAVDSGNWTTAVYKFCAARKRRGFYAVKGAPGDRPQWQLSQSKNKHGASLYIVGVDEGKFDLIQHLKKGDRDGPGFIHVADMGEDRNLKYVEQILSEFREVTFNKRGYPTYTWHRKPGRRAEALDCLVYARAVKNTVKPNWEARKEALTVDHRIPDAQREPVSKTSTDWAAVAKMFN